MSQILPTISLSHLNAMSQDLAEIGNEHIVMKGSNFACDSEGKMTRAMNWLFSLNRDGADQNRMVIRSLMQTIRQTEGMNESHVRRVETLLADKLQSGRPLTGREISFAMRDVISIKTSENEQAMAEALGNNKSLMQELQKGNPSFISQQFAQNSTNIEMKGIPLPHDSLAQITEQIRQNLESQVRSTGKKIVLENSGVAGSRPSSAKEIALATCKKFFTDKISENLGELHHQLCSAPQIKEKFTALLKEKCGESEIPITEEYYAKISGNLLAAIKKSCLSSSTVHAPDKEEIQDIMQKSLVAEAEKFSTVMKSTTLDAQAKALFCQELQHGEISNTVLESAMVTLPSALGIATFQKEMPAGKEALKTGLSKLATDQEPILQQLQAKKISPEDIQSAQKLSMKIALKQKGLLPEKDFSDEEKTLFSGGAHIPAEKTDRKVLFDTILKDFTTPLKTGTTLQQLRAETNLHLSADEDKNLQKGLTLLESQMNIMAEELRSAPEELNRMAAPPLPGHLTMEQVRTLYPTGESVGNVSIREDFDKKGMQDKLEQRIGQLYSKSPVGSGNQVLDTLTDAEKELYSKFSKDFLLNFFQNGLDIDGTHYGGKGLDNAAVRLGSVQALAAAFPSAEEAGKILAPLHQGIPGFFQYELAQHKDDAKLLAAIYSSPLPQTHQHMAISLTHTDDGYAFKLEHGASYAHESKGCSGNFSLSGKISKPAEDTDPQYALTNYDHFFYVSPQPMENPEAVPE